MDHLDLATFRPHHFDACREDFAGNGDIGRYVIIPGSNGRAGEIADRYFHNVTVKPSPRGHHLYLGEMVRDGRTIQMAAIATGMGAPSVDLILSELIFLGARRFLRIGTAGGMQPDVRVGDVVFATAAVRDESTSGNYVPPCFPAVADLEMALAARQLAAGRDHAVKFGIVHSKDSLYAREFLCGPMADEHRAFMAKLRAYGVVASEMEASHLFVLSQVYARQMGQAIRSGCVLGVIGDDSPFADSALCTQAIERAVDFGVELVGRLALSEMP
ncbi:uridine phosphorylase [Paludibacterium purpuratum]|uniref:Uridine phosphorylase n=1 Tax=Paludibacterium purpuratum TaxID=1144873 RepID=A0A4R7B2V5_9NEIS|nr:uridine phosphorylase [Paludibacterium purpuratum]TDR76494.1 uridine phosphorylase [Paludibacterium purpuratum]